MSTMNMTTSATSADKIVAYLDKTASPARSVAVRAVAQTGSTNADLMASVDTLAGPTFLVADVQTAGKGRAGRPWHTQATSAMTFSLAWPVAKSTQSIAGLSLAIGVVIAETLKSLGVAVELKWPNDVLRDGAKLAGILIEVANSRKESGKTTWVVIGVGLNLDVPAAVVKTIGRDVASAAELIHWEREMILAKLLTSLANALVQFEEDGFAAFTERWNALHAYEGRAVVILNNGEIQHEGRAVGIDSNGCFLIDTDQGRIAVAAGDVSLRLQEAVRGQNAAVN
jgi:BirA family biotin operon repressor/biotin-[acetyl-CoA-carboxylase] ligase